MRGWGTERYKLLRESGDVQGPRSGTIISRLRFRHGFRAASRFIFLLFFSEGGQDNEEIKNHSSGSRNATYVKISCPRLNATAMLLFYDPENGRTIRESSVRRMRVEIIRRELK